MLNLNILAVKTNRILQLQRKNINSSQLFSRPDRASKVHKLDLITSLKNQLINFDLKRRSAIMIKLNCAKSESIYIFKKTREYQDWVSLQMKKPKRELQSAKIWATANELLSADEKAKTNLECQAASSSIISRSLNLSPWQQLLSHHSLRSSKNL